MLYRIEAPRFVAGLITDYNGRVIRTAPILKRFMGSDVASVVEHCRLHRWKLEQVEPNTPGLREMRLKQGRI